MLQDFVAQSPNEPFPRYGLAMEHKNRGDLEQAAGVFAELIARFPDYTAAYLHAGNVLRGLGRKDDAVATYRAGLAACQRKGDGHAQGELEAALAEVQGS